MKQPKSKPNAPLVKALKDIENLKATQSPQITAEQHLRYRLPSEKPMPEDCCTCGGVFAFVGKGDAVWCSGAVHALPANTICWLPASLPAHLIPAPEDPLAKMRREFEVWAEKGHAFDLERLPSGEYRWAKAHDAFVIWQAARKEAQS